MRENTMKRIVQIEEMIEENGVYIRDDKEMNIMTLEDTYQSIEEDIRWVIAIAKGEAK